ncbi:MAG TPA: hypothetical protein VF062_27560 [Candidatus Limnocylindrales bacterium]
MIIIVNINWPEVLIGAALGAVLGTVPGFLFGRYQSEQQAAGSRRYEAKTQIREVVTKYREQLEKDYDQSVTAVSSGGSRAIPMSLANRAGQESLGASVLFDAQFLRRGSRKAVEGRLATLVGPAVIDKIRKSLYTVDKSPPDGTALFNSAIRDMARRAAAGTSWTAGDGVLTHLAEFPTDAEVFYRRALRDFDRILRRVKP